MTEEQEVPGDEEMADAGAEQADETPAEQLESASDVRSEMGVTEITSDDKLWAAIGYPLAIVALIVLFMDKGKRPFVKYHAIQSLAFNLVLWVVYAILSTITVGIAAICFPLFWLITFWPAYKAYQGEYMELPVISGFIKGQGWTDVS
jgi:uncharacterized membrane protein